MLKGKARLRAIHDLLKLCTTGFAQCWFESATLAIQHWTEPVATTSSVADRFANGF